MYGQVKKDIVYILKKVSNPHFKWGLLTLRTLVTLQFENGETQSFFALHGYSASAKIGKRGNGNKIKQTEEREYEL